MCVFYVLIIDQLNEIRKMTLAKIFCMASDNIQRIQKFVMLQPISEAFKKLGQVI